MKKVKLIQCALVVSIALIGSNHSANAAGESIGSLSHIHSVRALGNEIILGTHEGLFQYMNETTVKRISPERFDVMGLAVSTKGFYASGHPGQGSKLVNPVGLLFSSDRGKNWKQVSLAGVVDFHTLETIGDELYGADSGSGQLMYSANAGKSWVKRGLNTFTDIAPDPKVKSSVLAVKDGKLHRSKDGLKTSNVVKTNFAVESIDWIDGSLLASSGKILFQSINSGSSWKKLATMPAAIGSLTQSRSMIAFSMNGAIYSSSNGGKGFKKYEKR